MAVRVVPVSVTFPGTLTADKYVDFKFPFDVQLIYVSACAITNNCAIKVGNDSDDDAYVDATDGAITAATVLELDTIGEFIGDQYPHITAGTDIRVTFDHTGSNPADFFALLLFTEG